MLDAAKTGTVPDEIYAVVASRSMASRDRGRRRSASRAPAAPKASATSNPSLKKLEKLRDALQVIRERLPDLMDAAGTSTEHAASVSRMVDFQMDLLSTAEPNFIIQLAATKDDARAAAKLRNKLVALHKEEKQVAQKYHFLAGSFQTEDV